jgi:pyruvate, water dikinase
MKLPRFLRKLLRGNQAETTPTSVEELRAAFRARYHSFKLLLTANNKALEIMSDLEKALGGSLTFGMSFVRSNCTAVTVNVFRIIKHLEELAPGKYTELYTRFKVIQELINDRLEVRRPDIDGQLVIPLKAISRDLADQVGNKMANVAEIGNTVRLLVPSGFVITAHAYNEFINTNDLQVEIDRRIQSTDSTSIDQLYRLSAEIQQLIIRSSVPSTISKAITDAYADLEREAGQSVRVSLRSSALGEDSAGASFAGQFRSELNVSFDNIVDSYKQIVAGKYGLPAVTYRLTRGIPDEDVAMCVGCMAMVDAVAGGVMYSANPLNIRDNSIFINSVWGLPKAVVDGSIDPDLIVVSRTDPLQIVHEQIGKKDVEFHCYPEEGVCRTEVAPEKRNISSISSSQSIELAAMAVKIENYYGAPQDIEWAITPDGKIYILQSRPLQQMKVRDNIIRSGNQEPTDAEILVSGGITASPGVACGSIFVVKTDADKLKFPRDSVLVTSQSLPRWAPLLSTASAIVTEYGGVAGHLANVAREFGIPALFGVPAAVDVLVNGDLVTVDASAQKIYKGKVQTLLSMQETKKNLMEGSPIYEMLRTAAQFIVPLSLLDPDSTDFHPRKCDTLHDITRFCHEKAVHEMFSFGKEHHFSERSSKQLVFKVPMQWWIINLDDGFKEDVAGKFVDLNNIACIPMLAIWEGVIAVPWEGPPPVDAGGFMSVLMQATTNPALDPTMKSAYAARNYFMISKHFCSLNSRFGFHFSTVEALVGERPAENYISFSFKGGAADYPRRVRRAAFVGSILEDFEFHTQVKQDSAFARVEAGDENYMKEKLRILGYLIMHTRQLDMVMANGAAVEKYRRKILDDLGTLIKNN